MHLNISSAEFLCALCSNKERVKELKNRFTFVGVMTSSCVSCFVNWDTVWISGSFSDNIANTRHGSSTFRTPQGQKSLVLALKVLPLTKTIAWCLCCQRQDQDHKTRQYRDPCRVGASVGWAVLCGYC